ncbi:unnamed protein product [Hermetia illucens]|uniref:Uncharacterized protein n=1 Tax=Hermetia illucens TaxID=343691 RepID=A0A7R8YM00_HERIL|nr:unnamed protein product [Hermetia illucens]
MFHTNNESENCTNQEIYCAVLKTIVLCRKSKGLLSMKLCFVTDILKRIASSQVAGLSWSKCASTDST